MNRLTLLLSTFIIACNISPNKKNTGEKNIAFESFTRKFKSTSLPITIKACDVSTIGCDTLTDSDSLFIELSGRVPFYTFKTNGNYVAVISLGLADCSSPILTTFDTNGKKLDEQYIAIGLCGAGPGFTCNEYMTLKKDYTLYTSDTIKESEVDSLSNAIPGTEQYYVVYKQGKLLSSGKIELTDTIRKNLKN